MSPKHGISSPEILPPMYDEVLKLRTPFFQIRSCGLTLQNFSVLVNIRTVPGYVSRKMSGRWFLPVQSSCNLLKINPKYSNSYSANTEWPFGKPSGPTISFFKKTWFAELHRKWYGNFGLLWNFLFGHIPNTGIHRFKQYSTDCILCHISLPHIDKGSSPELIDLRLIGQNHFADPRGKWSYYIARPVSKYSQNSHAPIRDI
jgi:hypothetical protein